MESDEPDESGAFRTCAVIMDPMAHGTFGIEIVFQSLSLSWTAKSSCAKHLAERGAGFAYAKPDQWTELTQGRCRRFPPVLLWGVKDRRGCDSDVATPSSECTAQCVCECCCLGQWGHYRVCLWTHCSCYSICSCLGCHVCLSACFAACHFPRPVSICSPVPCQGDFCVSVC